MHTRYKIDKRKIYPGAFINMSAQKTCVPKGNQVQEMTRSCSTQAKQKQSVFS